jgi:two-component system, chemotaxis family, CheB/CheR fusion protein
MVVQRDTQSKPRCVPRTEDVAALGKISVARDRESGVEAGSAPTPASSSADREFDNPRLVSQLKMLQRELVASREELRVLNDELSFRIAELDKSNVQLLTVALELATQKQLLTSAKMRALLLDDDLCVRWFTPAVTDVFPLLPTDIGRSVTDLARAVKDRDFIADVHAVLESGAPLTSEVLDGAGQCYARSIHRRGSCGPYPAGVIVTFANVEQPSAAADTDGPD